MPKFTMCVGLPGSGKSTFCKTIDGVIISSDNIRQEVFGDVNDQKHNAEVFDIIKKRTIIHLQANEDVVCDSTNLNSKRRMNFIKEIRAAQIPNVTINCLLFTTPLEECIANNLQRSRHVPFDAIMRMYKSFQPPYLEEGWNCILFASTARGKEGYRHLTYTLTQLTHESHDNPHHSLTIGDHMMAAFMYALTNGYNYEVVVASLFHDIAKGDVKTFTNSRGEETEIAHYYGHNYASAYMVLSYRWNDDNVFWLKVANLIAQHMIWFNGEEEEVFNKVRDKFGEEFAWNLIELYNADRSAH